MKNEIAIESPKKAVIYCRVSTKEQVDEGNSLVSQERLCREYAVKEGYVINEVFIEKGESAKTANRTELQNMLGYCANKQNGIEAVIAYKVDRISRNIADYSYIKVKLKKNNIVIKSVTEFFEDTPAGRFMENIIANVSQFDNEVRAERSVGGMKEAMQEGRYVWKAPLGYDNAKVDNKSTIVPNTIASLIKETFELVSYNHYPTEVVRHIMRAKGLCDKQGNCVSRSYFYRLLRNPIYKGTIRKFGITSPGTYEAIVNDELFDQVQNVLKGRKNKTKQYLRENPDFPLRRFVVDNNNRPLTGYWSKGKRKKYPYYSFSRPNTTIRKEVLEKRFSNHLSQYAFKTEHLATLKERLIIHFEKRLENEGLANDAATKRIDELNQQIDNLIAWHSQRSISEGIFQSRIEKCESELEGLNALLHSKPLKDINIDNLLESVAGFLLHPHIAWQKSPVDIRRRLQVFVFPQGIVFNGSKFRTPKTSSVFKAKLLIPASFDAKADLRVSTKNTVLRTKLPPSDVKLMRSKVFWEEVLGDLYALYDILRPKEKEVLPTDEMYWWMAA